MIYDFGLMKGTIKDIIDSFDHATAFWNRDNNEYIDFVKKHSARWISLPVSPSAEQFSRLLFALVNEILLKTKMNNGESNDIAVNSVIVHETDTGYAQAFRNDVYDRDYGICLVPIREIEFSQQVIDEWSDRETFAKLFKPGYQFENPICAIQVK
jgi:6-pyruvoyltetrahydropterin/6-carboxytetrahydropterin synthase